MVRVLRHLFSFVICALFFASTGRGETRISQEVRPNFGTMDDAYILSVIVEEPPSDASPPLLTGGTDFDITLIGPSRSVQIINGTVHRRDTYDYQLTPKREGILGTPIAEITIDGKRLTAEQAHITVKGTREASVPSDAVSKSKDIFMLQSVNPPQRAFVGQQITHTLEIFTRTGLMDPQLTNLTFPGFRNEPLGDQENGRRYINGVPFAVSTLRRALFPESSGAVEIAGRELKAKVRAPSSSRGFDFDSMDPFDPNFIDSFFTRGTIKPITLQSNALQLQIDPLPQSPSDLPLLGLDAPPVGQTVVRINYDNSEIAFGDTKTVLVTISTVGNIQTLRSLGLKSSPALKIYEERPQTKNTIRGDMLWTTKTVKISLVPLAGNQVDLPAIQLAYFNPTTGRFEVAASEPISFTVQGSPVASSSPEAPRGQGQVASSDTFPSKQTSEIVSQSRTESPHSPPRLTYEEPGAVDLVAAKVSLPLALLGLTTVGVLALAVFLGLQLRTRGAPRRAIQQEISNSHTADQLAVVLRTAIAHSYPNLSSNFSRDELRQTVRNKQLLYQIESIMDSLDSSLFGGQRGSFEDQKAQISALLKAL